MIEAIYEKIPSIYRDRVEEEADYADIEGFESKIIYFTGLSMIAGIILSYQFLPLRTVVDVLVGIISGLASGLGVPWAYIAMEAERRKSKMDENLPDALRLIASNTRSGHTLEKSFLLGARDEFGPLSEELQETAMDMYGGKAVEEALRDLEDRIKSDLFSETLNLLIDGIKAGGNKADLLESSAEDIRNSIELREEIKSSIRMYIVFILMVSVAGAPLLFSISVYMADVTTNMWEDSDMGDLQGRNVGGEIGFDISFSNPQVNVEFFRMFAYAAIALSNIFAALIISEINNGNVKEGFKYIPIFLVISILVFTGANIGIEAALGNMN
jgi:Flp pilus assembly protein TadB